MCMNYFLCKQKQRKLHPHLSVWEIQIWKCYHFSLSTIDNFELKHYLVTIICQIWAKGYTIPMFKSGSRDGPSNYRGITIVRCLCKLFVKILNNRLENVLLSRNIIRPEQIGFCKGKRTSDHHFVLKSILKREVKNSLHVLSTYKRHLILLIMRDYCINWEK